MPPKPEVEHLEKLVAQGRHAEALEGYMKLLAQRPGDPLLRSRVEMLKEAQASGNDAFDNVPVSAGFVITQEEVADSYVLAGRYDDALVLLEKMLRDRPAEKAITDRIERVKKLRAVSGPASDGAETTQPQGRVPPPRSPTPKTAPSPIIKANAQTAPKAPAGPIPQGRTIRGMPAVTTRPNAPAKPQKSDPVEAAAATLLMTPATRGHAPVITVTDDNLDKNAERTLRSAPPARKPKPPVTDATVVTAPPPRDRSRTVEQLPAQMVRTNDDADEFSSSSIETVLDLKKDDVEELVATVMAPAPDGLSQELRAAIDEVSRDTEARPAPEATRIAREMPTAQNPNVLRQSIQDRARNESPLKKPNPPRK